MQRTGWLKAGLLVLILSIGGVVSAREFFSGDRCTVEADQVIDGNLFVICEELVIEGQVHGDIIGAAMRTTLDGRVRGNVYLVGAELDVRGVITQDLHFGGVRLRLNPPPDDTPVDIASVIPGSQQQSDPGNPPSEATDVPADPGSPERNQPDSDDETAPPVERVLRGSLKSVALSQTLYANTRIDDGIISLGYQLMLRGDVGDEISYWGSLLHIGGSVDGDVYATVGDPQSDSSQLEALLLPFGLNLSLSNPGLFLGEGALIDGTLAYTGPAEATLDGTVTGEVVYEPVDTVPLNLEEPGDLTIYLSQLAREFTTLVFIGSVMLLLVSPRLLQLPLTNLRLRPFGSFSVGMLAFILSFPVVLIAVLLSVLVFFVLQIIGLSSLGVAVGIVLALLNVGGGSLFFFVAIFLARALVGLGLGRFLLRLALGRSAELRLQFVGLVIGVLLLSAAISLPIVGPFINAAALFLGLGTILNVLLDAFRRLRDSTVTTTPAWYAPSSGVQLSSAGGSDVRIPDVQVMRVPDSDDTPPPVQSPDTAADTSTNRPPVTGAGLQNLPDGFDMSFFEDDDRPPPSDET
jgi:hypothetical protein